MLWISGFVNPHSAGYLDESGRTRILKAYFKEETPLPRPPELQSTVDQLP